MKVIEYKGKKYETIYDFPILDKEKIEELEELEFELFIAKQLKDKIKIKNAKRKITLLENKIEKEKKNGKTNEII